MTNWNEAKQNKLNAYLLFLVWPSLSLIYAIINYRSSFSKNITWLFCGFYGYNFVLFDNSDAYRYREWFEDFHRRSLTLGEFFSEMSQGNIGKGDYFEPILSYFLSIFTGDYRILFMVYGLVFGYFFTRNIWYLINNSDKNIKLIVLPFLLCFILALPIWRINGFRFWTAAQIFCFGVMRLFYEKKSKYLLVSMSSVFVHVGFFYAVGLLLIHYIVGVRKYMYLGLFAFGVFFSTLDVSFFLNLFPNVDGVAADRIDAYTHPDMIERYFDNSHRSWFMQLVPILRKNLSIALIIILALFKRNEMKKYNLENLLYFGVLIFGTTALLGVIPSMGRFNSVASLVLFAVTILYLQRDNKLYWVNRLSPILIGVILFLSVIEIRLGMASIGINTFITNPFIAPFFESTITLWDLLK
ncbi:MAG: EpsG family protein [Bacteroidetes bacterium]|nr:EpsG family protein [Bacteroidota bacterium]